MNLKGRDFLKEIDFSKDEFLQIIETAEKLKKKKKTIITNEDYSPGFFTALMPLNLDDFNDTSSFYKLDKDFLILIEDDYESG